MAATSFKVTVDDSNAKKKIAALEKAAGNLQPIYETVGNVLLNRIRLCFKLGIDPWGSPWAKIKWRAPRTQKVQKADGTYTEKRRKDGSIVLSAVGKKQAEANQAAAKGAGKAGAPLRDRGLLQRSISSKATADGVIVGTNLRQAKIHQFGGTIRPKTKKVLVFPGPDGELIFAKKVTIPARPYLPLRRDSLVVDLPPAWSLQVKTALKTYLRQAAEKVPA